ncbi:MAG: hypothetical protein ACRDRJ_00795 [Streptosporangiaceae bacterium]
MPDNFAPDWRPGDYTAQRHATLIGDRERLTGAQADCIDALAARVDELAGEVTELRELLHLAMQEVL